MIVFSVGILGDTIYGKKDFSEKSALGLTSNGVIYCTLQYFTITPHPWSDIFSHHCQLSI